MQPLRIGIDFDGVVVDHRPRKAEVAREMGVLLEPWQVNSNFTKTCFSPEAYAHLQARMYGDDMRAAPPVIGAFEAIARLPGEVYIVSARRKENIAPAVAWMRTHGLFDHIPESRVIFCDAGKDKRGHCERLNLDVFLDDKLSYLLHVPETISRVLFDPDHIASRLGMPSDVRVAENWPDFLAIAEAHAAQHA